MNGPHIRKNITVASAMRDVGIALLPVTLTALYFFRLHALVLIAICLITAVGTEWVASALKKRKPSGDKSVLITGLLVALLFPATTPWWTAVVATVLAVGVAKELMGGIGWNIFNPALFGRVATIIIAPWLSALGNVLTPINLGAIDVVAKATPLALLQQGQPMPGYLTMFLAYPGGALSETSALALLLGGAYLLYRGHISWRIPVSMIGTVAVLSLVLGSDPLYNVLIGGLLLGAFFMATDWTTSPITPKGKLVAGVLVGALVVLFRLVLPPTEGVAFSILIMNACVPVIEKYTRRAAFGKNRVPAVARSVPQQVSK